MEYTEAHVVLGYSCNSMCKHCVVQVKRSRIADVNEWDLTTEEARELIETIIRKGANEIVLSGGEPTLRADLEVLVKMILNRQIRVQIQTNGIKTDSIASVLQANASQKHLLSFMIPLHADNAQEHDYVTSNNGGFKKTEKSLQLILDAKVDLIGKIVLSRFTGALMGILQMYERFNAKEVIITYPHCVSYTPQMVKAVDLHRVEVIPLLSKVAKGQYAFPVVLQAFPSCFIGADIPFSIQEQDQGFLQRRIVEHKYRDETEYPWHEYRLLDKRKFANCSDCVDNRQCEGIWKEYIKVYGEKK